LNKQLEAIETLLPDFQYVDEGREHVILTVGFTATFYFWNGHAAATRAALANCFAAYESAFGQHLVWKRDADEGRWVELPEAKPVVMQDYVRALDEDDRIEWYLTSDEDHRGAGEYVISCLTARRWMEHDCSCLQFRLPRNLAIEQTTQVLDLVSFCCQQLRPFHANAGLSAVSTYQETLWDAEKLDLATRYAGLYVDSFVIDKIKAPRGLKGINWLTFISDTLTECLGGPALFLSYCRNFGIEPAAVGNGFLIRAGDYPQLGPIELPLPDDYVRVNAALRPLRNGNFGSMGTGSIDGELRFDRCTSDLWQRRFDMPRTWPPKTFVGLPRKPLGSAPVRKIKLRTTEACIVHGRYRELGFVTPAEFGDEDMSPMVILLPGDVAPYIVRFGPHGADPRRQATTWELVAEL
jgi:hypothetical protein